MSEIQLKEINSNFRGGVVPVEQVYLNIQQNTGDDDTSNQRNDSDFGDFPIELAILVCDNDHVLTEDEIQQIKEAVEQGDSRNDKGFHWLVKSVIKNGVVTPVEVYAIGNKLIAVDGNRRTAAAHIAKKVYGADIKGINTTVLSKSFLNPRELLKRQWIKNKGRSDVSLVSEAKLFKKMEQAYGSLEAVSEDLDISIPELERIISVLNLTPEAQKQIEDGRVLRTPILNVIKAADNEIENPLKRNEILSEAVIEAATEAVENGKNKTTEKQIKQKLQTKKSESKGSKDSKPAIKKRSKFELLEIAGDELNSINWKTVDTKLQLKVAKLVEDFYGFIGNPPVEDDEEEEVEEEF